MEEIDHTYTDELVCPYCGYEFEDSWEFQSGESKIDCYECEKTFIFEDKIERSFTSWKVPCLNGEKAHNWRKVKCFQEYPNAKRCRDCGETIWK